MSVGGPGLCGPGLGVAVCGRAVLVAPLYARLEVHQQTVQVRHGARCVAAGPPTRGPVTRQDHTSRHSISTIIDENILFTKIFKFKRLNGLHPTIQNDLIFPRFPQ